LAPEFLNEEYVEMARGIEEEKELASSASYFDIFKGSDRRRTIICLGTVMSHSGAGLWLIIGYGTFFFQIAGVNKPFEASIISTCGSFAGVLIGLYFTTKVIGRRTSMLFGSAMASLCMLAIGVAYVTGGTSKPAGSAIVAFMVLYGFFYNGFSGTLSWPIATEVCSSRLRVLTIGLCTGINYFFNCKSFFALRTRMTMTDRLSLQGSPATPHHTSSTPTNSTGAASTHSSGQVRTFACSVSLAPSLIIIHVSSLVRFQADTLTSRDFSVLLLPSPRNERPDARRTG
jgi:hypothetical protein